MEKADKHSISQMAMAMDIVMGMPLDVRVGVADLEEKGAGGREPGDTDSSDEIEEVTDLY
ncbi:MAG: hypothetical protein MUO88_18555 [Desulfobacterales bacterium]|nr:hypothetical protein [Desulfobacterales bacterium]